MMDKKLLLVATLSTLTLIAFHYFNRGDEGKNFVPTDAVPGQGYKVPTAQDLARPINTEIDFIDKKITQKEELKTIETDLYKVSFSNYGATLANIDFKKYLGENGIPLRTIHRMSFYEREQSAFLLALEEKTPYFYNFVHTKDLDNSIEVLYQTEVDGWTIKKNYILDKKSYKFDLVLDFEPKNKDAKIRPRLFFTAPLICEITPDKATGFVVDISGRSINKINDKDLNQAWVAPSIFGAEDKYFANSLVNDLNGFVQRTFFKLSDKTIFPVLEGPEIKEKNSFKLSFYIGPKLISALHLVDDRLEGLLSFGWLSWFCKLFLMILQYFYSLFKNFGVAIIIFAIILKIPFMPLTIKGKKQTEEYQKHQPTLQRIRLKYRNDVKKQQDEIMKYHKDHNLSLMAPFVAMLPLLIQIPIMFALYRVLDGSLLLYQAPFFGWIIDLSSKDPYYVLPILMGLTMVWQQLVSPGDSKQKVMMLFMPVILVVVFANLPAGVVLYWVTNNLLMVGEDYLRKAFF